MLVEPGLEEQDKPFVWFVYHCFLELGGALAGFLVLLDYFLELGGALAGLLVLLDLV